jgi:hypothetical protein
MGWGVPGPFPETRARESRSAPNRQNHARDQQRRAGDQALKAESGPAQTGRRCPNDERREQPLRGAHMQAVKSPLRKTSEHISNIGGREGHRKINILIVIKSVIKII